jgi:hypothetical protein
VDSWTLTYLVGCVTLIIAIYRARGVPARPAWGRVVAWWLGAALCALLVWSTLGCAALPLVRQLGAPVGPREWAGCVVGSGFWAGFAIGAVLPFYGLLLTWYTIRFGRERGGWSSVNRNVAFLGLPPAIVLLYGYAWPAHNGVAAALLRAFPFAVLGFVSAVTGLLVPRRVSRRLGPGCLLRPDVA